MPLKNKFQILDDKNNESNVMEITISTGRLSQWLCYPHRTRNKMHPFYIEIKVKWHELAGKIKELNENSPLINMDGEL